MGHNHAPRHLQNTFCPGLADYGVTVIGIIRQFTDESCFATVWLFYVTYAKKDTLRDDWSSFGSKN